MRALLGLLLVFTSAWADAGDGRPYPMIPLAAVAETAHTHVCIRGEIALKQKERDGDWHLKIVESAGAFQDGDPFVVGEVIPTLKPARPFMIPKMGQRVEICGIVRRDKKHQAAPYQDTGWPEIHPVESLNIIR